MTKQPLIFVVGPTATGKTDLALQLAEALVQKTELHHIALISADSRQVYEGLETISGADIPDSFERHKNEELPYPFYISPNKAVELHGVSIVSPTETWSLGRFHQFARKVINATWKKGGLPIVVGGTGLYLTKLLVDDADLFVPPNQALRAELAAFSLPELQARLQSVDEELFTSLNQSDKNNKRRLVRWVEKKHFQMNDQKSISNERLSLKGADPVWIGLTTSLETIEEKIEKRVKARWEADAVQEVSQILSHLKQSDLPVLTATGVTEIAAFLQNKLTAEETLSRWVTSERQYAKRQLTWWKKHAPDTPRLKWFEATDSDIFDSVWQYLDGILELRVS